MIARSGQVRMQFPQPAQASVTAKTLKLRIPGA